MSSRPPRPVTPRFSESRHIAPLAGGTTDADGGFAFTVAADAKTGLLERLCGLDAEVIADGWIRARADIKNGTDGHIVLRRGGDVTVSVVREDGSPGCECDPRLAQGTPADGTVGNLHRRSSARTSSPRRPRTGSACNTRTRPVVRAGALRWLRPVNSPDLDVVASKTLPVRVVLDEGIVLEAHVVDVDGRSAAGVRILAGGRLKSLGEATDGRRWALPIAGSRRRPRSASTRPSEASLRACCSSGRGPEWRGTGGIDRNPAGTCRDPAGSDTPPLGGGARSRRERSRCRHRRREGVSGAQPRLRNPIEPRDATATSGADGVFALPPLVAGAYSLTVEAETPDDRSKVSRDLTFVVGTDPVTIDVVLAQTDRRLEEARRHFERRQGGGRGASNRTARRRLHVCPARRTEGRREARAFDAAPGASGCVGVRDGVCATAPGDRRDGGIRRTSSAFGPRPLRCIGQRRRHADH